MKMLRKLSLLDSTFLVIGSVIGSGIFMTTGFIAEYLPSPGLIILVWLAGGVIALSGALTFAELGAMIPRSGGHYVYMCEAYGPWVGFIFGWGFFWVMRCGAIAALAVGFVEYLSYFIPSFSTQSVILHVKLFGISYTLSKSQIVAVVAILFLSGVNHFGVKSGIFVQNLFTFLKLAALAALVIFGLSVGRKTGITDYSQWFSETSKFDFNTVRLFGLSLIAVFWTYGGWHSVNLAAEEVKKPEKNIPLSLLLGTLGVSLIYFLVNVVYVMALPIEEMKGVARIGELASTGLFGPRITAVISGAIMVSILGCLSALIFSGPRVYFAMADNGSFFRRMSFIHPRYHVPTKAIAGQAVWASLLCLSGTYKDLYEFVVFAYVIFYVLTGLAVLILRRKQPDRRRPYKVWGYPVLPLFFAFVNMCIFFNTVIAQPIKSGLGLIILLLGIPAFLYWKVNGREYQGSDRRTPNRDNEYQEFKEI